MAKQIALPVVAVLCAIALGSYVQGRLVDRWAPNRSDELKRFEEQLKQVPMVIGDWEGVDLEEDQSQFRAAKVTGSVSRAFRNRRTGEVVNVFLVCGKSLNVADHTPEQCYVAQGFTMLFERNRYRIDVEPQPAHFYYSVFQREQPDRTLRQLIFWTWHAPEGVWRAPDWPVSSFTTAPALYKMYLISEITADSPPLEESSIIRFARDALPVLEEALFPSSAATEVAVKG